MSYKEVNWKKMPAFKLLLFYALGIVIQNYYPIAGILILCLSLVTFLLIISYEYLSPLRKYKYRFFCYCFYALLLVSVGMLITHKAQHHHYKKWYGGYEGVTAYQLKLLYPLESRDNSFKVEAKVSLVQVSGKWHATEGNLLLYLPKDSLSKVLSYGDRLLVKKEWQLIKNTGNPSAFDYERYVHRHGLYHSIYLAHDDYKILSHDVKKDAFYYLYRLRACILGILDKYVHGQEENAVAKALLIGYRDDIDSDLQKRFQDAGVVHIIAISGMHIAMIFIVLQRILRPLYSKKYGRFYAALFILLFIWIFTFLAGAVPSITRAAVMFSFMLLGDIIGRKHNIYNTLAASALLLLLINPYYLWDVGFLLSYTAVLSILLFYEFLYKQFYFKNAILKYTWQMIAVCIAAQLLTLPLILYYFKQFPLLFVISNIVTVPLSYVILCLEIILVIISPITVLANVLGVIVGFLLFIFNLFVDYISHFSFAKMVLQISETQFVALILILIFLHIYRAYKLRFYVVLVVFMLLATIAEGIYTYIQSRNQKQIIVYNAAKNIAIDFIEGRFAYMISQKNIDHKTMLYTHLPTRYYFHALDTRVHSSIEKQFPFIYFHGKSIFIYNHRSKKYLDSTYKVDILIVADNVATDSLAELSAYQKTTILFANTNTISKIEKWKNASKRLNLPAHSLREGAYVLKIK